MQISKKFYLPLSLNRLGLIYNFCNNREAVSPIIAMLSQKSFC